MRTDCCLLLLTSSSQAPALFNMLLSTASTAWHWPLQEKVEVNGPGTHPVWKYLKGACPTCDGEVTWNFKVGGVNLTPKIGVKCSSIVRAV